MGATVVWTLVLLGGSAGIALIVSMFLTDYMRGRRDKREYVEYTWMSFRRTMVAAAAITASIFGFTQAADIIRALGTLFHGGTP